VPEIGELQAEDFAQWQRGRRSYVLLDVRRDEELALASLPGALHIPMHDVPRRLNEIPRGLPVVVMCHAGERSRRVAQFLAAGGFDAVYNLEGGIDEYAERIDPSIPRYF
jgi:rhodanese-related sulfurtransferase